MASTTLVQDAILAQFKVGTRKVGQSHYLVAVDGLPSAQSFGVARSAQAAQISGVPSAQAFGVPTFAVTAKSGGVPSAQAFGAIVTRTGFTKPVPGLGSAQAFGILVPHGVARVPLAGLGSAQAFGVPLVRTLTRLGVGSVPSAQAFGTVTARLVWLHPRGCGEIDLASLDCLDLVLAPEECLISPGAILNTFLCGDGTKVGRGFLVAANDEQKFTLAVATTRTLDLTPAGSR